MKYKIYHFFTNDVTAALRFIDAAIAAVPRINPEKAKAKLPNGPPYEFVHCSFHGESEEAKRLVQIANENAVNVEIKEGETN